MANFFKRLFGKNETKTSVIESNVSDGQTKNVQSLNTIIRDAYHKGGNIEDNVVKYKDEIEELFPKEPEIFNHVYFIVTMINALISEEKLTEDSISRLKKHAKDSHINEQTIDFIIAEKKKKPELYKYHVPKSDELDRYSLELKLLPLIVNTYNEALKNGGVAQGKEDIFMDINFWQHIARTMNYGSCDFDWHDLSFHKQLVGHLQCIAMTFPKPLKSPQAKYGLVVIDKKAHYFTLEQSVLSPTVDKAEEGVSDNPWYLCGIEDGKHVNYCPINRNLTLLQFIEIALQKIYQIKL